MKSERQVAKKVAHSAAGYGFLFDFRDVCCLVRGTWRHCLLCKSGAATIPGMDFGVTFATRAGLVPHKMNHDESVFWTRFGGTVQLFDQVNWLSSHVVGVITSNGKNICIKHCRDSTSVRMPRRVQLDDIPTRWFF